MDNNNFDISNITDIQGGTYNYSEGYFNLIDQNGQEMNFTIQKAKGYYIIKNNNEVIGTINSGTRKIVLKDKEFSMLSVFDENGTATILKSESLNIGSVQDIVYSTTENYLDIYDENGRYIQFFYRTNEVNEDGSFNLLDIGYTVNPNNNFAGTYNPETQEIKIMRSDGVNYDVHKNINGTFYKLSSPTLANVQNVKVVTVNQNNMAITTADNEILDCTLVPVATEEGNTIYYIQDSNGNNVAIYDSAEKQIISTGSGNSIDLDNNSSIVPTVDGNSYVNLVQLDINSLSYNINTNTQTLTLNGYEFELEPISGQSNQYKIAGLENTLFNPASSQIQLPGQEEATYFATYGNDNTFYSLEGTIPGVNDTTSVTLNIDNDTNTGTITINGTPYNLQSIEGSNGIYYIQNNGTNVAIYDDNTKEIISAGKDATGQNNSINFANNSRLTPTADGNSYIDLQQLEVNSLLYDTNSTPPTITLNGYEFDLQQEGSTYRLDKYPQSYFDPHYVQLRLGPSEDNEYFYLQFKDIENNDMFYKFNIRNAIIPDLEEVTYISVDIDNLTLNTSEQEYTLEQIDNTDMYFLKFMKADGDGRMTERCSGIYDKSSGKIIGIGNNNVLNFNNCALTANGTYCPLSGYMSESDMENIKLVTINGNNISITIDNDEPLNYTLVPVTTEENNTIYYIQKANGENIAIYDSGEKQIVSVGSENKVDFNNNSQFALAINEDAEIYVDLSKLDITSLSYNTTSTPQTITLNGYTFELTDYDSVTGNYKIAGIDGTVFNPLTSQITIPNGESFRFVCDQNNIGNFYKFSDDLLKCDEIDMVVFSQKLGTSTYNGATINNDTTYDFVDHPDSDKRYLKLLKNSQGEIVCGYNFRDNSIFEIDNGIFDITLNNQLYLGNSMIQGYREFVIEVNSLSWSLDSFQPKLTINGRDFNLYDYNIDDGNYKIHGALSETTFNPDTLQITNSNNETFKFTIYDGKAYTSPVNEDGIAQYVFEPYNGEVYKLSNPPLQDLNNILWMDINESNIHINRVGSNDLNGTLVPARTEGDNTIYYIQDLDGNNLAIYDNNAHKIISANSESLTLAQNINHDNRYMNLDRIDINSLSYTISDIEQTIILNGRKFNLTNYDSETGNYQIAGVEGTLFNSVTSQIKFPGQNQPTYFTVDSKNDFYALDGSIDNINNIFSITINGNDVSIMMLGNDEPLNCTLVSKPVPFTCRYIQDQDGNNIAIWDPGKRQIITVGSENFANLAHPVGPIGNNIYINLQHLDINSLSHKTDSIYIYPDVTLNGYEFKLTDYNQETGEYKIAGFEGTLFNPTTGQIQLPGQTQATYFATDINNNFYALEGKMDDINEITSVTLNLDNTDTQTITIDGTPYNLQPVTEGSSIYYIQNNGVNVAIYDSNAKQIVSAGSENLANVIQPIDNTVYINLQTLDINSLEYYYGSSAYDPVWIKLNGYKFNLECITLNYYPYSHYYTIPGAEDVVFKPESGQIQLPGQEETYFAIDQNNNFYALAGKIDTNNITSVTIDNNNISITIGNNEPSTYALVSTTTAEDNTIYYIQNAEGKNVAIYDDNTKEIISAGRYNSIDISEEFTLNANGVYTRTLQNSDSILTAAAADSSSVPNDALRNIALSTPLSLMSTSAASTQEYDQVITGTTMSSTTSSANNNTADGTQEVFNELLDDPNATIKGYIADGNFEGLKEYLNKKLSSIVGDDNTETLTAAKQVIADMQLNNVKTYEDFIDKLNDSLAFNNLPTLDVGLEKLEELSDSGLIKINVDSMNVSTMITYVLFASVATGLTSLAVNRINDKMKKKDLEKTLKKFSANKHENLSKDYGNNRNMR